MWIGILFLPTLMFAAPNNNDDTGLEGGIEMVAQTGTLFGIIIVVVAVALWLMPIAFAGLVYTGQKKKAEQAHEEVGLKAAILALLAAVLGAALAYYVVGTIGKYAENGATVRPANTLEDGNKYILSKVIGNAIIKMEKH